MRINLCISTMNERINNIFENIENISEDINVVVCHQITDNIKLDILDYNDKINILSMNDKGLSKNRNCFLDANLSGICVVCDDDVKYVDNFEQNIKEAYKEFPDADIITFQVLTPDGEYYKKYSNKPFVHNKKTIARVSSVEITYKIDSVKKANVRFDEYFGLGSKYKTSEEFIFLSDCLKKGLKAVYYPLPICIHPIESSGKIFSKDILTARGAVFYRVFGNFSYIISILYAIKKHNLYKNNMNLINALNYLFRGIKDFKHTLKKRSK